MKNNIALLIIMVFTSMVSFAQVTTQNDTMKYNTNPTSNVQTPYLTSDIVSDFGPRRFRKNTNIVYDWHGGLDFARPTQPNGDVLFAPYACTITEIDRYYGVTSIAFTNGSCALGFRHIFTETIGKTAPYAVAGNRFIFIPNTGPGGPISIIDIASNPKIAYCEQAGLTLTYNSQNYTTTNVVAKGKALAQLGDTGAKTPHLHLQGIDNPTLGGSALWSDNNAINPLKCLAYARPFHSVTFVNPTVTLANIDNVTVSSGVTLNYSAVTAVTASPIALRVKMPREALSYTIQGSQRYQNAAMDIERIELMLKPAHLAKSNQQNYQTIKGTSRDAFIDYGGFEASENMTPYSIKDQIGKYSRTGVSPSCYRDELVGHPWDNFFFTEFIPKIRASDVYNNSTTLVARHNDEARYPDGKYHLYAKIQSAKGLFNNPSDSTTTSITIDNFAPFVHSLQIWESSQLHPDSTKYKATGTLLAAANGSVGTFKWLSPIASQSIDPDNDVVVNVFTSEAMDSTSMRLKVQRLSDGQFLNLGPNNQASPTWMLNTGTNAYRSFTFRIPSAMLTANLNTFPTTSNNATFRLVLNGRDQNGNNLIEKRTAMTAGNAGTMTLRVRTGNAPTAWSSSYSPTVTTGDSYHEFKTLCASDGQLKSSPNSAVCTDLNADFTYVTNGLNVVCTDASSGSGISLRTWNMDDGITRVNLNSVSRSYPAPGVYPVVLTISKTVNGTVISSSVQKSITVTACTGINPQSYIGVNTGLTTEGYISLFSSNSLRYQWSNGATTPNIAGLANGDYSVTLTDIESGCVQVNSYRVSPTCTGSLYVNANVYSALNNTCGIINTSISNFGSTGPLPAVTYRWSNGATTPNISGVVPGNYTLTVTDAAGCRSLINAYSIGSASFPIEVSPFCGNTANVALRSLNLGSTTGAQFTYRWTRSGSTTVYTTNNLTGVPGGTYALTITRTVGTSVCNFVMPSIAVTGYSGMAAPTVSVTSGYDAEVVNGAVDYSRGWIDAEVTNPQAGAEYAYLWSNGMTGSNISVTNGTYTVTVTDLLAGCTATASHRLCPVNNKYPVLNVNYPTSSNTNGSQGSGWIKFDNILNNVTLNFAWSTPTGTFNWSSYYNNAVQFPASNLSPRTYSVTISEAASGCSATRSVTDVLPSFENISVTEVYPQCGSYLGTYRSQKIQTRLTSNDIPTYEYWWQDAWSNGFTVTNTPEIESYSNLRFIYVFVQYARDGYAFKETGYKSGTYFQQRYTTTQDNNCVRTTLCGTRPVETGYIGPDLRMDATCQNMVGYCNNVQVYSRPVRYDDLTSRGIQVRPRVVEDTLYGRCDAVYTCSNTGREMSIDSFGEYFYNWDYRVLDGTTPPLLSCYRDFRACSFSGGIGYWNLRDYGQDDRVEGGVGPILTIPYGVQLAQRDVLCPYNNTYYRYSCFGRLMYACEYMGVVSTAGWVPTKNAVSLQNHSAFEMSVFPNPSDADFYFKVTSPSNKRERYQFELYNILGSVVQKAELGEVEPDYEYKMPFNSDLPIGTYLLKISSSNGEFQTFKIQKQ